MTQTQPLYEPVHYHIDLRLTRLGGRDVLDALTDRIETLEDLIAEGILLDEGSDTHKETEQEIERLRMIAWAIESQLVAVREVTL